MKDVTEEIPLSKYIYKGEGERKRSKSEMEILVKKILFTQGRPYVFDTNDARYAEYADGSIKKIRCL